MNTKNKQNGSNRKQKTRQKPGPKKQGQYANEHHEHEYPEMRLSR